jgi:hypothetical protein
MGSMTIQATIAAWQEKAGIEPAQGAAADLLQKMSDGAFQLIKVIELQRSGIREGDGCWHGADVMGAVARNLVASIEAYDRCVRTQWERKHPTDDLDWMSDPNAVLGQRGSIIETAAAPDDDAPF